MTLANNILDFPPNERREQSERLPIWLREELEDNGGLPAAPYSVMAGGDLVQWMPDGEVYSL